MHLRGVASISSHAWSCTTVYGWVMSAWGDDNHNGRLEEASFNAWCDKNRNNWLKMVSFHNLMLHDYSRLVRMCSHAQPCSLICGWLMSAWGDENRKGRLE